MLHLNILQNTLYVNKTNIFVLSFNPSLPDKKESIFRSFLLFR